MSVISSCGDLSTGELLRRRHSTVRRRSSPSTSVTSSPPITSPCRKLRQGANCRQHMIEWGVNPDDTLARPRGYVPAPAQVSLLEHELRLVFGKPVSRPTTITADTRPEYVALLMTNDLSGRDIQLPQNQCFKGKSYRGFCPAGPVLRGLEPDDCPLHDELELTLLVNERVRQHESTANLVYRVAGNPQRAHVAKRPRSRRRAADRNAVRLRSPRAGVVRATADGPVARTRGVAAFIKAQKKRRPTSSPRTWCAPRSDRRTAGSTWRTTVACHLGAKTHNQDHGRPAVSHISGGTS